MRGRDAADHRDQARNQLDTALTTAVDAVALSLEWCDAFPGVEKGQRQRLEVIHAELRGLARELVGGSVRGMDREAPRVLHVRADDG